MSELATYLQLGFRHIVTVEALDHILFLVALAAIYRPRDVREVFWVVTAFTVGHTITLALAVTGVVRLPGPLIEFLIPVTIIATGIENLAASGRLSVAVGDRTTTSRPRRAAAGGVRGGVGYRPLFAGLFGLVHGAGFANYLNALFVTHIALPLFGFNVGIEAGQIVVLAIVALVLTAADWTIARARFGPAAWSALRVRTTLVSVMVVAVASYWAIDRRPW